MTTEITPTLPQGTFVVIEGPDGVGKTTQVRLLKTYLTEQGYDVLSLREPGGTSLGEQVRKLLLNEEMTPIAELLLFMACRMELIQTVIQPALKAGKVVLCDRFIASTIAYQGYGRGLHLEVDTLLPLVESVITPNHTLFLELPQEEAERRMELRSATEANNRLDNLEDHIKSLIRKGFEDMARGDMPGIAIIDAGGEISDVHARIKEWANKVFPSRNTAE